jgi:hypothetical protein
VVTPPKKPPGNCASHAAPHTDTTTESASRNDRGDTSTMGVGNVKLTFVYWGTCGLPGGPFRLLVYMAMRSRDGDSKPTFWAGREDLAYGLGRQVPTGDDPASKKARAAAFQAVKDALAVLAKRGAIVTKERARPGKNAVYQLNLAPGRGRDSLPHPPVENLEDPGDNPVDNQGTGEENPTPNGVGNPYAMGKGFPTEWGREILGTGEGFPTPEEEKEESGLNRGVEGDPPPAPSTGEHSRRAANNRTPFDYRSACAYLLTIPGPTQAAAEQRATAELGPNAQRETVLIRAAHIAREGIPA